MAGGRRDQKQGAGTVAVAGSSWRIFSSSQSGSRRARAGMKVGAARSRKAARRRMGLAKASAGRATVAKASLRTAGVGPVRQRRTAAVISAGGQAADW